MTEQNQLAENQEIIIAIFPGEHTAKEVVADIKALGTGEAAALVETATIIAVDEKGKIGVDHARSKLKGPVVGGVIGALAGTLLGLPVAGAAIGGVVGAYGMRKRVQKKSGIDGQELKELMDSLQPDSSMVIAVMPDDRVKDSVDALESRGATKVVHADETHMAEIVAQTFGQNN